MAEDKTRQPGTVHRQKARKQHDCDECADPILKGQSYIYLNTFDEYSRQWSKYLLCQACERIQSCHMMAMGALGVFAPYSKGQMRSFVKETFRSEPEYKKEFLLAWEASGALGEEKSESC
jgi:hypothetical protein